MLEKTSAPVWDEEDVGRIAPDAVHHSMFRYDALKSRACSDFSDFKKWADANPDAIAEHFELYERYFTDLQDEQKLTARAARFLSRSKTMTREREQEYADYFGLTNLARLPGASLINAARSWREVHKPELAIGGHDTPEEIVRSYAQYVPGGIPEDLVQWSGDRLQKLYRILPEFVIQENGLEKVVRVMMGVVAVAAAEMIEAPKDERYSHIAKSVRPAYFYAATYPIVDDILQDSGYIADSKDKSRYHEAILRGLTTGEDIAASELPDHPLAEEMLTIYDELRETLPFEEYRDTYYALESMYRAQHEDANRAASDIASEEDLYAPIALKASLSRVVAHAITGRNIEPERSARMLRSLLRQQLADDHRDTVEDLHGNQLTPFTLQITEPDRDFTNPLFYRIAQEAYVIREVYGHEDSERVEHALSRYGAYDMLRTFDSQPASIREAFSDHGGPIDHMMRVASGVGKRAFAAAAMTPDKVFARQLSERIPDRDPQLVDPRTYISDALPYINEVLLSELPGNTTLEEVMRYALEAGGKRVRPALTLMLAESLGMSRESIEPLLISTEFTHTASLIFDDLPAQDNATLRRGKAAVHVRYPEYDAQLAGISMISHGVGVLGRLGVNFPADRVNEVVEYTGTILGAQKLCLGQHMDLAPGQYYASEEIIEMYSLKTSTMIEAALVPLLMLDGRSQEEVELMQQYAYHAGIVFQLRDDILDATSSAEVMGKHSEQDEGKQNIVTMLGVESAQKELDKHLEGAVGSLTALPFPTDLLQGLTTYFATRNK